jgi:hemolysin type calcium-binding protein/WD40 repeat protein/uncharacterized protein DUF11
VRVPVLVALLLVVPVALARADAPARPALFAAPGPGGGQDVFVDAPHGGAPIDLSAGSGGAFDPRWSPDGSMVVFASSKDIATTSGIPGLYVVAADGSGLRRLTTDSGVTGSPSWSPDGSRIAYLVHTGGAADIWIADVAAGRKEQVTLDGGGKGPSAWSPDGSAILYTQQASDGLWVAKVDVDDHGVHRLAQGSQPVWSPDGSRIAFVDAEGKLAEMAADGSGQFELAGVPSNQPVWSPDGTTIVFTGNVGRTDLYAVPADGSKPPLRITGPFDPHDTTAPWPSAPSFSPDGARIFFRYGAALWSVNANGTCAEPWLGLTGLEEGPFWRPGTTLGGTACVDLYAHATISPAQVALKQPATVTVTVENHGNLPAHDVMLGTFPSAPFEKVEGCPTAYCSLGTLPPGGTATATVRVSATVEGVRGVRFEATSRELDPTPADAAGVSATTVLDCSLVGSWGADRLQGTPGADHICGLPGPDWINGGKGNDLLDGGNGNDTIFGGPGHDTIYGRGGRDTIFARDGQRDSIDCGTEYDVAVVDRFDRVSDCERVLRK